MKIRNRTSFVVIAFGWFQPKGYADDVSIPPGQTAEVNGPYVGEMGGGSCYISLAGEITCHETPDDDRGLYIAQGAPISLADSDRGVTIRHHTDELEQQVSVWRMHCRQQPSNKSHPVPETRLV